MLRNYAVVLVLTTVIANGPRLQAQITSLELPLVRPMAIAYSPDGRQVAVAGFQMEQGKPANGIVSLVDVATGKQQFRLELSAVMNGPKGGAVSSANSIRGLAFSPDGRALAVASDQGLKLWDPATGKERSTVAGYEGNDDPRVEKFTSVAFSPDGNLLAAINNKRVQIWDAGTLKHVREFEIGGRDRLLFSPDGALLIAVGPLEPIAIWDVATGTLASELKGSVGLLKGMAIHPSGKQLAAVGKGGEKLWQLVKDHDSGWSLTDETPLTGHAWLAVQSVAFSPDGKFLATAAESGVTLIYEFSSRQIIATLLHGGPFAFAPDGNSLAVAESPGEDVFNMQLTGKTNFTIWPVSELLDATRMAEQARAAANELIQLLMKPQPPAPTVQGLLAVLAGPQGDVTTTILVDALQNPRINQKSYMIYALGRFADRDQLALSAICIALTTSKEVDVRQAAVDALAQLSPEAGKEAVPALAEAAIKDLNPDVRARALHALTKLDPQEALEATRQQAQLGAVAAEVEQREGQFYFQDRSLNEWLNRLSVSFVPNEFTGAQSPKESLEAIRAMGPQIVPALIEILKDGPPQLRRAAAKGLGTLGPQAEPAVEPILDVIAVANIDNLIIAGSAADALTEILRSQKELPTRLIELTRSDNPAVRLAAARVVAALDQSHPRGLAVLSAAFSSLSARDNLPIIQMGKFPEKVSAAWLARVVADDETPYMERTRAIETLAKMGEEALPALPALLKATLSENYGVSHPAILAIPQIGPSALPIVRDTLRAATDDKSRQRYAAALWGLNDEGRLAVNEFMKEKDSDPLWWEAVAETLDLKTIRAYEMAANEGLLRAGKTTPPRQPRPNRLQPSFKTPSTAWSAKMLADEETPREIRIMASSTLFRAPPKELEAILPELLIAIGQEKDRTQVSQLANVIQRIGPTAIPAVKTAIAQEQPDYSRRELLRALSSLGKEGNQEFQRLMQINPEYGQLFRSKQREAEQQTESDIARLITPGEKRALADAESSNRPLTNGDFRNGLEGWNIEGGATAFRTYQQDDGWVLSTFGEHQDADTGRLYQCFRVPDDAKQLTFKLHGGANRDTTYVALWRKNYRHGRYTARNDNKAFKTLVDLTPLRGEVVTLEIVDHSAAGWGFIGAENFQIVCESVANNSATPEGASAQSPTSRKQPTPRAENENLISDPSLESTPLGELPRGWSAWLNDGPDFKCQVVEGGVTGKQCLQISGKGTRGVVFCGNLPLDRSKRYALKGQVKFEGDPNARAIVKFNYFHAGKWLGVNDLAGVTAGQTGWQLLEKTDVAASIPEATQIVPTCHVEGNGTAWFDDLEFIAYDRDKVPTDFEAQHGKNNRPTTLSDLKRWIGRWETTTEYKPTAATEGRTIKAEAISRNVFDDKFLITQWTSGTGGPQSLSILAFDENIGSYHLWLFGSTGEVYERIGQWDSTSQTLQLELKPPAPGVTGTSTDRFVTEDRIESTLLVKSADGQVKRDVRTIWLRNSLTFPAELSLSDGPASNPKQLTELKNLVGTWTVQQTNKPSIWFPISKTTTLTEQADWAIGGQFLILYSCDEHLDLKSFGLLTYVPAEKSFHYWHFAQNVYGGQWSITWDSASRSYQWRAIDMPAGWVGTGINRSVDKDTFDNQALIKDDQDRVLLDMWQEKKRKK